MSKKLTAIELASKKIKEEIHIYGGEGWDVMEEVLKILHEMLEIEQDQIEEAYNKGSDDEYSYQCVSIDIVRDEIEGKNFYKKTYGQPVITITTQPDNHD